MVSPTTDGEPDGDHEDRGERLPASVLEDLLASSRRRRLLSALAGVDDPVPIDDAAVTLVGEQAVDDATRRRLRTELYQTHLPKLTATGVVRFDSMLGTVEFTGPPGLRARIETLDDERQTKDK